MAEAGVSGNRCASCENFYQTRMLKEECSFCWTIENFSWFTSATRKSSSEFPAGAEIKCKWILQLIMKEVNRKDHVGLDLSLTSYPKDEIIADIKLSFHSSDDKEIISRNAKYPFSRSSTYCCPEIIRETTLLSALQDDVLKIKVKITAAVAEINYVPVLTDFCKAERKLKDDYSSMLKSKKFCDVTVQVGDEKILAHRAILSARSSVLAAMLNMKGTKENISGIINLREFDAETVLLLLDFIYTSKVPELEVPMAMNLLRAADFCDLQDLKTVCAEYLAESLDTENAVDIVLIADMHSAEKLREKSLSFMIYNRKSFGGDQKHDLLKQNGHGVLAELLDMISET